MKEPVYRCSRPALRLHAVRMVPAAPTFALAVRERSAPFGYILYTLGDLSRIGPEQPSKLGGSFCPVHRQVEQCCRLIWMVVFRLVWGWMVRQDRC